MQAEERVLLELSGVWAVDMRAVLLHTGEESQPVAVCVEVLAKWTASGRTMLLRKMEETEAGSWCNEIPVVGQKPASDLEGTMEEIMSITFEKFLEEFHTFYDDILCTTNYTVEEKREAYSSIMIISTRVKTKDEDEKKALQAAISLLGIEVPMRLFYEENMPCLDESQPNG